MTDMWRSDDGGATWVLVTNNTGWSSSIFYQASVVASGVIIMTGGFDDETSIINNDVWKYEFPVLSSSCIITNAVSGDIYNIGGVSGESTKNIIFTLWDNKGYGRGME